MFKKGPIPPFVHGLLDYGLAALLIAAPFLFDFEEDAATAVAIVAGVLVLIVGASTDWVTGIIKVIPPPAHAMLDYLMVVVLIATPFVFAFSDSDGTATAFFIVVGVVVLLVAIATRFTPAPRGRATAAAR